MANLWKKLFSRSSVLGLEEEQYGELMPLYPGYRLRYYICMQKAFSSKYQRRYATENYGQKNLYYKFELD